MLRAEVIIKYAEEFGLAVSVLGLKFNIIPRKAKKVKPRNFSPKKLARREAKAEKEAQKRAARQKEKQKKKEEKKAAEKERKKQGKQKKTSILEMLPLILTLVKTAVGRFAKHLRVRVARLHISVGGEDAAKIALTYGVISQSAAYIAALLDSTHTLRFPARSDVNIHADYLSEKITADIEIGFSVKVWQVFDILIRTAAAFIKEQFKK